MQHNQAQECYGSRIGEESCPQDDCMPSSIGAEDFAWDPTMAACCIEDIKNQRKGDAVRQKLLAVDPTRLRAPVISTSIPPAALAPGSTQTEVMEAAGEEGGQSEDEELAALRVRRKGELQQRMQQNFRAQAQGFGQLNDVSGAQLMERLKSSSGCSVCHCSVEGFEPSNQLDQHLEALAHQYRGTLFLRTLVGRKSPLKAQLSLPCLPALVCFRNGAVVGRTGLLTFGPPDDVLEELDDEGGSGDQESWKNPPCEVCGRCYPHEHVKAIYREHPSSDEEGSDFD
ncbi:hypothetical protein DUNSADRAFT_13811 [Dunaliella salina]|uniref:C2H2-type domain-containing protein n=1 Tax=Dunaliella salina TaxID=3046 RepID=A0ABQ7G8M2_DUNSA|nr:hypothetical protein DUNSADRAFT_13811 [Dunaliella salina]|eukprot:KAF5830954.1 hypothetical protein DUNSADRAFT_13811 [Dunaliella salina]